MRTHLPRTGLLIAGVAVATLVLSAGPALAGQRGHESRSGGGQAHVSSASRSVAPARAVAAPQARAVVRESGPVVSGRAVVSNRFAGPQVVGRAEARPYGVTGRTVFVGGGRFVGGPVFSRPFYSFRPRYNLGFGLFVGYPVAFPYGYYYSPYNYAYGYPVYGMAEPVPTYPGDGYYGSGSGYTDNSASYGGVTFDIQPANASVYVDGKYVGTVAEFSAQQPPLSLTLGRHHVDIRLQGFQTLSFDVDAAAGQVTPYQGAMQPIR
jgi:hypothetical protein